ncbi:poly(U)-specific endoribonuclease-A [Zootoca vivipara]|uniref:poly(U)-specific endoribonuclease-A n=1 Tax=Zootoca vivipara TaxID=8524 RepID=UPI00293BC114|nr:poly(U)-specific endoribonuclease-A [Zootoca vivipara]
MVDMAQRQILKDELSKLFNELWDADVNRFVPGKDYTISLQGKAGYVPQGSNAARDSASEPLFCSVNEQRLKNTETYSTFISLLDNYETSTGMAELVTAEEIAENNHFLDAVLETEVMKVSTGVVGTPIVCFSSAAPVPIILGFCNLNEPNIYEPNINENTHTPWTLFLN